MIGTESVVALIPARGGSKGFPGKNLALLDGLSLLSWSVRAAKSSRYVDRIIVSTDSEAIANEARRAGAEVPFMRPSNLAGDETPTSAVADHLLRRLGIGKGWLVLLQPTSPLRAPQDIDACLDAASAAAAPACVSVVAIDKSPYWMYRRDPSGELVPYFDVPERPTRRQDAPDAYVLNGAVYVVRIDRFLEDGSFVPAGTLSHVMSEERSVDIDRPRDLEKAEQILARARAAK